AKIVEAYTVTKKILKPGGERIIVTLLRPRQYRVMVLREDAGGSTFGTSGGYSGAFTGGGSFFTETRKASGFALDLPAYENDVLNALTRSGGLPGVDAENEIIIERGANRSRDGTTPFQGGGAGGTRPDGLPCPPEQFMSEVQGRGTQTLRIPLRVRPGQDFE